MNREAIMARLIELDEMVYRSIISGKPVMGGYNYGRMAELLDLVGRTNEVVERLPAWRRLNTFKKLMRESELY